jgi:hypothetical protein
MRQEDTMQQNDSATSASAVPVGAVDTLSPLSHHILKLDRISAYARPVVHGDGNEEARPILEMLQPDQLLSVPVVHPAAARAMLAGLWLWHDWLAESHAISQALHDSTGSFWHAIMHRREGDFSNSKYWFAKVGRHPILPAIGVQVGAAINPLPADKSLLRLMRDGWDPSALVDLVEDVCRLPDDPRLPTVVAIQRIEWQMLFDHCTRQAGGK